MIKSSPEMKETNLSECKDIVPFASMRWPRAFAGCSHKATHPPRPDT